MTHPKAKSPISSGWRGNINGHIEGTGSYIQATEVTLRLDRETAWALCNLLGEETIKENAGAVDKKQGEALSALGAALARFIDHPSANNGGREIIK
jgi:hypothetical protein